MADVDDRVKQLQNLVIRLIAEKETLEAENSDLKEELEFRKKLAAGTVHG